MNGATTLAARIKAAYFARQSQIGDRLTLAEFGAEVARAEGRPTPYKPSTVTDWIAGRGEPRVATIAAIARLVGLDPAALAFGPDTAPAAPPAGRPQPIPAPPPEPEVSLRTFTTPAESQPAIPRRRRGGGGY